MRENVTISYRGASYEIGRGQDFYGIWAAGAPRSHPFERWPKTPEGWYGAWSRFTAIEAPGTIIPVGQAPGLPGQAAVPASVSAGVSAGQALGPAGQALGPAGHATCPAGQAGQALGPIGRATGPADLGTAPAASAGIRGVIAAVLLAVGVACGVAGLFPGYIGGASLAQEPAELWPHAIYFAAWTASALLILPGGTRLRAGALLGIGTSIVTFGLFFADAGTAIAGGAHLIGAGLVLGLAGWLACAAGSAAAFGLRPAGAPGRPAGNEIGPLLALTLAALGAAVAFAPSWDSYTLRASDGLTQSLTAGNAFANPALVIAGDVAVMVALVAVVVAAALWRPVLQGAALLAGAIIPMAAQAISALVALGEATTPALFGIPSAQAAQAGLTISSGVTPAFWIYCAFIVALVVLCVRMLMPPRSAALDATPLATSTLS